MSVTKLSRRLFFRLFLKFDVINNIRQVVVCYTLYTSINSMEDAAMCKENDLFVENFLQLNESSSDSKNIGAEHLNS